MVRTGGRWPQGETATISGAHIPNLDHMMTRVLHLDRSLVRTFEDEAYGACLTLVYKRAMPRRVRNDLHMIFMERGRLWGGKEAAKLGRVERDARQVFYKRLVVLNQAAFVFVSFDAINQDDDSDAFEPEPLILNPWALSDSEFYEGMILLSRGIMPNLNSSPLEEYSTIEAARSAASTVVKHECIEFIAEFLKEAAEELRPLMRATISFAARASVIAAFFEALSEASSSGKIVAVRNTFLADEPRRIFLNSVGWGDYVKPAKVQKPSFPSYMSEHSL